MCTSDIENYRRKALKTAFVYLLISLFCALFGGVYEVFANGVISFRMVYAFAIPLVGGTLPFLSMGIFGMKPYPAPVLISYHHCAIATFTLGTLVWGALDIYGTSNSFVQIYYMAGVSLLIGEGIAYVVQRFVSK